MSADFEQFVKERIYLKNVSPRTVDFYRDCWRSFERYGGELSKPGLAKYVIAMREAGVKPVSCNTFISGINAYLRWRHENDGAELLKIQKLKVEQKVIPSLSDAGIRTLLTFKPTTFGERRLHAVLLLALDTGCRIDELLTLRPDSIDLDNLLIRVVGKGSKERLIPISPECRKTLFRFLKKRFNNRFDYVFGTRHGDKVSYHNLNRDYRKLCEKLRIKKEGSFHRLRHTFALHYVRNGGGLFHLQKQLGHTTLSMTKKYCELEIKDLQQNHRSLLSRF